MTVSVLLPSQGSSGGSVRTVVVIQSFLSQFIAIDLFVNPSCGPPPPPSCHATGTRADGVNVVIDMVDSYGDGWDGAYLGVCKNGITTNETISSGGSAQVTLTLTTGDTYYTAYVQFGFLRK